MKRSGGKRGARTAKKMRGPAVIFRRVACWVNGAVGTLRTGQCLLRRRRGASVATLRVVARVATAVHTGEVSTTVQLRRRACRAFLKTA